MSIIQQQVGAMSYYVFTAPTGIHFRHQSDPFAVAVVDEAMRPIGSVFEPLGDDYRCDVSLGAGLFALGYWRTDDLRVYDLQGGKEWLSFPFRKLEGLTFDGTGKMLLLKSASQVWLLNLKTAMRTQVKGLMGIDRRIAIDGGRELIVPSQRKGQLLRVSFQTGNVSAVPLPIDATFSDLKKNPISSDIILIDRKKGVHCLETTTWRIVWSVSLKKDLGSDHMGVGQFSGNGRFFGGSVTAFDHNYTVVIEAETGKTVNRIDRTCEGLPWRNDSVRSNTTKRNTYVANALDLCTGTETVVSIVAKGGRRRSNLQSAAISRSRRAATPPVAEETPPALS